MILGVPILFLDQLRDLYSFTLQIYRDDVKEFGFDSEKKQYNITEEQFKVLESFCHDELKKHERV